MLGRILRQLISLTSNETAVVTMSEASVALGSSDDIKCGGKRGSQKPCN